MDVLWGSYGILWSCGIVNNKRGKLWTLPMIWSESHSIFDILTTSVASFSSSWPLGRWEKDALDDVPIHYLLRWVSHEIKTNNIISRDFPSEITFQRIQRALGVCNCHLVQATTWLWYLKMLGTPQPFVHPLPHHDEKGGFLSHGILPTIIQLRLVFSIANQPSSELGVPPWLSMDWFKGQFEPEKPIYLMGKWIVSCDFPLNQSIDTMEPPQKIPSHQ